MLNPGQAPTPQPSENPQTQWILISCLPTERTPDAWIQKKKEKIISGYIDDLDINQKRNFKIDKFAILNFNVVIICILRHR